MNSNVIHFPKVNKRTHESPTLAQLVKPKVMKLTEKVKRSFPRTPGPEAA